MLARLFACLMLAVALSGAAAAVTLNRGNAAEPETLDPHKYGLTVEFYILQDLFEGLVIADAKGQPAPGIAQSWTMSPDGLTYTFKLRPGLTWSDGSDLTMDDILLGFRRSVDPKTAGQLVDLCFVVKNAKAIAGGQMAPNQLGVRALDPLTLEVTMEQPNATFIRRLAGFSLFTPVPSALIVTTGDGWVQAGTMISNGPYRLTEWTPQSRVHLVKNPNFHDAGSVQIDDVYYYPTTDDASAVKQFQSGELDMNLGYPPSQQQFLKQSLGDAVRADPVSQISYLAINGTLDKFKDKRVRRALSLAIDRETIVKKILGNGQIAGYSIFPTIVENWQPPPEDDFSAMPMADRVAQARQLLADAGYDDGNPLSFRLDYRSGGPNKLVAVALGAMWKAIGVNVELQGNEVRVHYRKLQSHDFEIADAGWQGTPEPEFFVTLLASTSVTNYGQWANAEFDRLSDQAVATLEPGPRMKLFQQADRIAIDDTAAIPIFYNTQRMLVQSWVKGFEANPANVHPTRFLRVER